MRQNRSEKDPRAAREVARYGSLLFGVAAAVTALGLLFPHQPQAEEGGLLGVAVAAGAIAITMRVRGERFAAWGFALAVALGTTLVTFSLVFNGERSGGAAGGDEVYYLWVAMYSAHFFGRRALAFQVAFIALAYGMALYIIDPGPVAVSRWLTIIGLVAGAATIVRALTERNDQLVRDLDKTARTDRLTGLPNRLAFEELFGEEIARSERNGRPLTLVLADVDRLKAINDRWGHAAGDVALAQVGQAMRAQLRPIDTPARIGGDEFAILMPDREPAAAAAAASRLGMAVQRGSDEPTCTVALTFGQATFPRDGDIATDLMRTADIALYAAKPPSQSRDGRLCELLSGPGGGCGSGDGGRSRIWSTFRSGQRRDRM